MVPANRGLVLIYSNEFVLTKPKPYLQGMVYKACTRCGAPNPHGLTTCPCGANFPEGAAFDGDAEFGFSVWFPILLVNFGFWLRDLAKKVYYK